MIFWDKKSQTLIIPIYSTTVLNDADEILGCSKTFYECFVEKFTLYQSSLIYK